MLNFLLGPKFLLLQFLVGYLFLLCSLLFRIRINLLFLSRVISECQGELMCGSIHSWLCEFWGASWELFTWLCSMTRECPSKPLCSVLLSAFLSMCSKNSALFLGHWLCVRFHCLAWAHLPNLTLITTNGTSCFRKVITFRYLVAVWILIPWWLGQFHECC